MFADLTQVQASILVGLIGAGAAIVGGLLANTMTQVIIFRKQDNRRWYERRAESFAEMSVAAMQLWDCFTEDGREYDSTLDQYKATANRLLMAHTNVALLCKTKAVSDAAGELWSAALNLEYRTGSTWDEVQRKLFQMDGEFMAAARKELNLPKIRSDFSYEQWKASRVRGEDE